MTSTSSRDVSGVIRTLPALCALLAVAALAATAQPARACSCIPPDPWAFLKQADGAFVGRLTDRDEIGGGRVLLTFSVERAVKGGIGPSVDVVTANNGAACGIETSKGQRIGLFLTREGGQWIGSLCAQVSPEDLLAAATLPAPNGRGSVAMFVGGRFGPARTLALDAKGRTIAYGLGGGTVRSFSVCPGGRRVAEIVDDDMGRYSVAVRDLPTLQLVRQQSANAVYPEEIACTSASGEQLAVFFSDTAARGRLTRVTPRSATRIWRGEAFYASLWKHLAYVQTLDRARTTLVAVDVRTARARKLGTVPVQGAHQLVPNSAGTRLTGDAFEEGCRARCYRLVLIDLERRPISGRTILLPTQCCGSSHWLRDGRIAYVRGERILVYNADLRLAARVSGWSAISTTAFGSRLVGVGRFGKLLRVELPSGRIDVMRLLPGEPNVIVSATG